MATAHEHIAEAEQLLDNYKAGIQLGLRDGHTYLPGDVLAVVRLLTDMAKVRLELERRAAENAATDRLLAEVKPSPRSLDPRRNQKNGTRRRTDRKSSAAPTAKDS
jgi:hypothetical protein